MELYKLNIAILKILLFGHFMGGKIPKKGGHIGFLAIKWPKSKIFKIATSNLKFFRVVYLQTDNKRSPTGR